MDMYTMVAWAFGAVGIFINIISVFIILKSLKYFGDEFKTVLKFLTVSIIGFCAMGFDLGLLHTLNVNSANPIWLSTLALAFFASTFFFLGARKLLSLMKRVKIK